MSLRPSIGLDFKLETIQVSHREVVNTPMIEENWQLVTDEPVEFEK